MLKYLIAVTEGMISTAALLGLLFSWAKIKFAARGERTLLIGTAAGAVCAVVMAVLKNTTSLIHTGTWNVRIFAVSLAALLLFGVFSVPFFAERAKRLTAFLRPISCAVIAFTVTLYALPDVLAYPYTFTVNGAAVLSTDYLFRLIGWAFGLILILVVFFAVREAALRVGEKLTGAILVAALAVNALQQIGKILQVLVTRRIIKGHEIFQIARFTSNHSNLFIWIMLAVVFVLPATLFFRSLHVNEPYENPAQHRKIRAKWRSARRLSFAIAVCFALTVSLLTWGKAYSSRTVELSPVEESEVRGDNVYVALTQVEDGHLHRFAYTTQNGVAVRFIVIKKPNSSSYGVGLDACDICGETGYYEKDGQIVCKLCDVVMNVNTIGFKGGCNPIVIPYSVGEGYIVVPTEGLIENEVEFTR